MPEPSLFRHYQIVQDADGNNVELLRNTQQVAVLAFDTRQMEFVHCHVLLAPLTDRAGFEAGCRKLQLAGHPLLSRLGDFGEDEGNPFYITSNVDGETLRTYLVRQTELPGWLAVMTACRALEAVTAVCERGDLLPETPMDSLRLVQTGPQAVQVLVADYRLLPAYSGRAKALKAPFEKQAKFLKAFLQEQTGTGPTLPDAPLPGADFAELLGSCLAAAGPDALMGMRELRLTLLRLAPDNLAGEIPTAQKPRALMAPHLASYQEVARGVVNLVRIQSQRLDMASPYSMRGTLTKTGRTVLVEQVPPVRLCGAGALAAAEKAFRLDKKREFPSLVHVTLVHESEGITCLAEEQVDGMSLAELLRERRALNVHETYLVLASLDSALTQLDSADLGTRRLRLEDIHLLTGFPREDARTAKLLLTKLNEWPSFTVMVRAHPTLAAMSGRGTDPAVLLPPPNPTTDAINPPIWTASWMAALGRFLLALEPLPGTPAEPQGGARERETVARLLDDEITKGHEGIPAKRADFLARYARVVQHHDLVKPAAAVPVSEPLEPAPHKPTRTSRTSPVSQQPLKQDRIPPVALTAGHSASTEKPSIGFAELLFRGTAETSPATGPDWAKSADDAPPTIHPDEALLPPREYVPLWLRAAVFLGGSMIFGAILAHLSGEASWQKKPAVKAVPVVPAMPVPTPALPKATASAPRPSPEISRAVEVAPPLIPPISLPAGEGIGLKPPSPLKEQIVDLPPQPR